MEDRSAIGSARDTLRVALVADGSHVSRRLSQTLGQIAELGVPGYTLDLIAGDRASPARPPATVSDALSGSDYGLIHVCTPGPLGFEALRCARFNGIPLAASYDRAAPARFYDECEVILSPSRTADAALQLLGISGARATRWRLGVDVRTFHPARYAPDALPALSGPGPSKPVFNVLHVGPIEHDHELQLLAEAFNVARDRDPRLRLVFAGAASDEQALCARFGGHAVTLGELDGERLARIYASADLLLIANTAELFGDTVLEAHASGLPVLAVDAGASTELIANGRNGCLVPPDPTALAAALRGLARRATLLERLATGGLRATRDRSWQASLAQLAGGYALATGAHEQVARAA